MKNLDLIYLAVITLFWLLGWMTGEFAEWSERQDLNLRPSAPKADMLVRFRHTTLHLVFMTTQPRCAALALR